MILIIMYDVFYENKHFLWSLIKSISTKQKYIINAHTPKLLLKKILLLRYKKKLCFGKYTNDKSIIR